MSLFYFATFNILIKSVFVKEKIKHTKKCVEVEMIELLNERGDYDEA